MKYLHLGLLRVSDSFWVQVQTYVPVITSHIIIKIHQFNSCTVKMTKLANSTSYDRRPKWSVTVKMGHWWVWLTLRQDHHKWQSFQKGNDMIYGREIVHLNLQHGHLLELIEWLSDFPSFCSSGLLQSLTSPCYSLPGTTFSDVAPAWITSKVSIPNESSC